MTDNSADPASNALRIHHEIQDLESQIAAKVQQRATALQDALASDEVRPTHLAQLLEVPRPRIYQMIKQGQAKRSTHEA